MKTNPTKVPSDYQPGARVYELAEENNIPKEFVDKQVSEFIFYWQEKDKRYKSWHRAFWNWVKNGWQWKKQKKTDVHSTVQFREPQKVENVLPPSENRQRLSEVRKLLR